MRSTPSLVRTFILSLALTAWLGSLAYGTEKQNTPAPEESEDELVFRIIPVAEITTRGFLVMKGGGCKKRRLAVYGFLVQHPGRGNILIDLGYPEVTAEDPGEFPGFPISWVMDIRMNKEDHIAQKIGKLGLDPEDVNLLLFTHLHNDHIGDIRLFPSTEILVHGKEWAYANEQGRRHGFRPDYLESLDPATFEFPESNPYGPFETSLDILEDGTIIAVPTPGHTKGHVSYFINTGNRSFFITGDTAMVKENFERPVRKGWLTHMIVEADRKKQKDSLDRIHSLYKTRKDLIIIPGHDAAVMEDDRLKGYVVE